MPPGFSGNLIFAIIARMLCGNHLNLFIYLWQGEVPLVDLGRLIRQVSHGQGAFLHKLKSMYCNSTLRFLENSSILSSEYSSCIVFVLQELVLFWEEKARGKGKERDLFLFEKGIVNTKRKEGGRKFVFKNMLKV